MSYHDDTIGATLPTERCGAEIPTGNAFQPAVTCYRVPGHYDVDNPNLSPHRNVDYEWTENDPIARHRSDLHRPTI